SEVDALSAWIMAAVITLQTYDRLLENEWRERTYTAILRQIADSAEMDEAAAARLHGAYAEWERQRPFMRGHEAGNQDYAAYRRSKFDAFLRKLFVLLP